MRNMFIFAGVVGYGLALMVAFMYPTEGDFGDLEDRVDSLEAPTTASCDVERFQRLYANALAVFWFSLYQGDAGLSDHEQFLTANQTAIGFDPVLRRLFDESTTGKSPPSSYGSALMASYFRAMSGECEADVEGEAA